LLIRTRRVFKWNKCEISIKFYRYFHVHLVIAEP
jgi:hypothetical protein